MNSLRNFGRYGLIIIPILCALSCGTGKLLEAFQLGKRAGALALKNHISHSKEDNLKNETRGSEINLETKNHNNGSNEPAKNPSTRLADQDLESSIINPNQPFIGSLPYYCNPLQYPAHIINAAAACKPYLNQIYQGQSVRWTDLYGAANDDDNWNYGRRGWGRNRYDGDEKYYRYDLYNDDDDFRHYNGRDRGYDQEHYINRHGRVNDDSGYQQGTSHNERHH